MSDQEKEHVASNNAAANSVLSRLFSSSTDELVNIKFLRGSQKHISTEQFYAQVDKALEQRANRTAVVSTDAPRSTVASVDVCEYVANLK
jgi:hypothetical protein